jgi:ABC-type methionine transport system ATPase subunit
MLESRRSARARPSAARRGDTKRHPPAAAVLRLNYPPALVDRPVVTGLISKFRLEVNILRARVTRDDGWMIIELSGDPRRMETARDWLAREGIEVIENPDLDDNG